MTPVEAYWWLNLTTTVGIAVLAIPVWSLNLRKKKLQAVRDALSDESNNFKDRVRSILLDKRGRDVADWRMFDETCLGLGYLLLLGSSFLRLMVPTS